MKKLNKQVLTSSFSTVSRNSFDAVMCPGNNCTCNGQGKTLNEYADAAKTVKGIYENN